MCDLVYIIDDIKTILYPIFVNYNVKESILFGSYIKGVANQNGDVDLFLDGGLSGLKFIELVEDIRSVLDKEVDVYDKIRKWMGIFTENSYCGFTKNIDDSTFLSYNMFCIIVNAFRSKG